MLAAALASKGHLYALANRLASCGLLATTAFLKAPLELSGIVNDLSAP